MAPPLNFKNKRQIQLPNSNVALTGLLKGLSRLPECNTDFDVGCSIEGVYMIVNNIPKHFRTVDLRRFFSRFIETGGFLCFHFRHRPEVQKPTTTQEGSENKRSRCVTCCCVIKVEPKRASEFIKSYNGEHWIDKAGETQMTRCFIKKIVVDNSGSSREASEPHAKEGIPSKLPVDHEQFTSEDLSSLIEMRPPSFMPNGNVGTKISQFLEEIRSCKLPPKVIEKLGLEFPRNRARKIYGSVPFDYQVRQKKQEKFSLGDKSIHGRGTWFQKTQSDSVSFDEKTEDSESEEEEWDRHNALHDDVTGQERTKERLFEDEVQLQWEKGGSGLVFYTDAQFWDAKEGDFDAKTADDWDVDTNIYRDPGMDCDKDAKDLLRMRLEKSLRDGTETEVDRLYDFAAFEKYSNGFGRKLMESQGWKQGQGIGRNCSGMSEPILNDGQKPTDKKGFGYRGEKLIRRPRPKKRRRSSDEYELPFSISTVYDNPQVTDPPDSVFTCTSYSKLKYRREFVKGKEVVNENSY